MAHRTRWGWRRGGKCSPASVLAATAETTLRESHNPRAPPLGEDLSGLSCPHAECLQCGCVWGADVTKMFVLLTAEEKDSFFKMSASLSDN